MRRCKWLIIHWIIILTAVFITVVIMISEKVSMGREAPFIFTMSCIFDVLAISRMASVCVAIFKDDIYKDYVVRKTIRKIRALLLLNLTCAFGVICWIWVAGFRPTDSQTAKLLKEVAKWLFSILLIIGLLFAKALVVNYYLYLKKYIPNLFSGFTVIQREEKVEEEYVPLLENITDDENEEYETDSETSGIEPVSETAVTPE